MSRLRRLLVTGRIFFITTHFHRSVLPVRPSARDAVLQALAQVRDRRNVLLSAYCVMPTHFHLMFAPHREDSMSAILLEIKIRSAKKVLPQPKPSGRFWHARSFDRIIRNRQEWAETLEYIHYNPVKDGLVEKPEQWRWSSWYGWHGGGEPPVAVDIADMPVDEKLPIGW